MTIATGGFFLASSLGRVTAVTTVNVLLQPFFTRRLDAVVDVPNKAEVRTCLTFYSNPLLTLTPGLSKK